MAQSFPRASSQEEEEQRGEAAPTSLPGSDMSLDHTPLLRTSHLRTHKDTRELRSVASSRQLLSSNNSALRPAQDRQECLGRELTFSAIGSFHFVSTQGKKLSCPEWREAGEEHSSVSLEPQAEACRSQAKSSAFKTLAKTKPEFICFLERRSSHFHFVRDV